MRKKEIMRMKKSVIMAAVMVSLLTAVSCGEKKNGSETAAETTTSTSETSVTAEAATTDASEAATEKGADEDTDDIDPVKGTAFVKGKVEGNVYTSEYTGMKFTAPDGWEFRSEDDITSDNQEALDSMEGEMKRLMSLEITDAEMVKEDGDDKKSIGFIYSNVKKKYPDMSNMTEEEFLDQDIFMGALSVAKESGGLNMAEPEKVTLGSVEFTRFRFINDDENSDDVLYIGRVDDDFMLMIAAFRGAAQDYKAFESCFEALS